MSNGQSSGEVPLHSPYSTSIADDIFNSRAWLEAKGFDIESLEIKSLTIYMVTVSLTWLIVLAVITTAVLSGIYVSIFCVLLLGILQRGLGNLLHDFAHGGFKFRSSDLLGNIFLGFPLGSPISAYRKEHIAHHKYLGDQKGDPDLIHDPMILERGLFEAIIVYMFRPRIWVGSVFGMLFKQNFRDILIILIFWGFFIFIIGFFANIVTALHVLFIWFAARATSFHVVTTFREMADHVGLQPGSIYSFTRNNPENGLIRYFVHPFNNGYHLAHHLFYRVPFYHIPKIHRQMLEYDLYRNAENCQTYFFAEDSNRTVLQSIFNTRT